MTIFDDDPVPPDHEADPALLSAFLACSTTIGVAGRMIAGSKTGFREDPRTRDHAAVFNANICLRQGKAWHGDLDLTCDAPRLQQVARELSADLYVLFEGDARFQTAQNPRLSRAVAVFHPNGSVTINDRFVHRGEDGRLRRGPAEPRGHGPQGPP